MRERDRCAARCGSGAKASSSSTSGAARSSKAASAAGKYSRSAERSRSSCRCRSQIRFWCPRRYLDPLLLRAVPGHRAQLVGIGAHQVGQGVRIPGVALGPRGGMPLPVPADLLGVDREHLVPGGDQRGHPRPPIGLDPDHRLLRPGVLLGEPADQLVQPGDPHDALRQPGLAQRSARLLLHLHIVVIFSPVVTDEQHLPPPACRGTHRSVACGRSPAA